MTRGDGNELAGAQVHGGPSRGYISPPRAVPVASASSSHPQERTRTTQSTPESFYARDRPELRRLGRPLISRYSPSPPSLLLDLEPPDLTDPFPSFSRSYCSSERANQAPPEAPPPCLLVAGEPGHPGDQLWHHPNDDTTRSPAVPLAHPAVPENVAGELALLSDPRLTTTAMGPVSRWAPPVRFKTQACANRFAATAEGVFCFYAFDVAASGGLNPLWACCTVALLAQLHSAASPFSFSESCTYSTG